MNSRWKRLLLVSALVVGGMSGTAWSQDGALKIGLNIDSLTLDPRLASETTSYRLNDLLYDGLVRLNENLLPVPALAASWEQSDPLTITFKLREDAKFHDGSPVLASDVVFTYQTMLDPELKARSRSLYTPIKAIEAVDDHTVKFTLSVPYAPLFSYLDLGIVPQKLVEANPEFGFSPVGSGPFRLESWERGAKITLVANEDYFGGKPRYDRLEFPIVPDSTARTQALEAGDLDLIYSPMAPGDINRLAADSRFAHVTTPSVTFVYVNFNTADPLLSDPKMRVALSKLIDQETIIAQIYGGIDQKATSILMPTFSWAYDPSISQPSFDIAGAQADLDALGWNVGSDGIRAKDGQKLTLTIGTNSEDSERVQSVEYIQNVFRQAGVDAQLKVVDYPTFMAGNQGNTYQISFLSWGNLVDPDRAMFGQMRSDGNFNWGKYSNADVDAALDIGRAESSPEVRAEAYRKAATIISAEVPYYIVSYQSLHSFASEKLKDFRPDARGFMTELAAPAGK